MTYLAAEQSAESGSPVELYLFQNPESEFAYTSGNLPVIFGGRTYEPTPLKRTSTGLGSKKASSQMTVTMSSDTEFTNRYINGVPSSSDTLTIYRRHLLDGDSETIVYWVGSVATVTFQSDIAKVAINPASAVLEQSIPRRMYSYPCNHVLYDALCTINKELYRSDVVVEAVSSDGTQITFSDDPTWGGLSATFRLTQDPSFFNAGYVQTDDGFRYRMILSAVGDEMNISIAFETLEVGQVLKAYAGCNHSPAHCHDKFSKNISNFGGFPHVPIKNPFSTGVLK